MISEKELMKRMRNTKRTSSESDASMDEKHYFLTIARDLLGKGECDKTRSIWSGATTARCQLWGKHDGSHNFFFWSSA